MCVLILHLMFMDSIANISMKSRKKRQLYAHKFIFLLFPVLFIYHSFIYSFSTDFLLKFQSEMNQLIVSSTFHSRCVEVSIDFFLFNVNFYLLYFRWLVEFQLKCVIYNFAWFDARTHIRTRTPTPSSNINSKWSTTKRMRKQWK